MRHRLLQRDRRRAGPHGKVTAVEVDEILAERARAALEPWLQATAVAADGTTYDPGAVDVIVASAGATHPLPLWLDALKPGGRLLFPLTADNRGGAMLLLTRQAADLFAARFLRPAWFIEFAGARDPETQRRLAMALGRGDTSTVKSLRRNVHSEDETCWLHGESWCLSRRDPVSAGPVDQ